MTQKEIYICFIFRPSSRPSYESVPPHPAFPHYGHVVHPRQHSNEFVPSRLHNIDHYHQRQNSDLSEHYSQDYYPRRPPTRSRTPIEHWVRSESEHHPGDFYSDKLNRQSPYHYQEVPPGGGDYSDQTGNYGNSGFAYRDPVYPSVAGKRSVQTITQPGSAKV